MTWGEPGSPHEPPPLESRASRGWLHQAKPGSAEKSGQATVAEPCGGARHRNGRGTAAGLRDGYVRQAHTRAPREQIGRKAVQFRAMAQASTDGKASTDGTQSLQSLERGIAVIQVFSRERPALTLSEVARLAGITRATARRILLTLEKLGHVRSDGRLFSLTPRVLTLGWAYLSSLNLWEIAQPLDGGPRPADEGVLLGCHARPPGHRLRRPGADGADHDDHPRRRLSPAGPRHVHGTGAARGSCSGRARPVPGGPSLERYTERTITDRDLLRAELATVRRQGWALVDGELETGLRSIAAPIRDAGDRTIAALNTSASSSRVSIEEFQSRFLPALLETASAVSANLLARMPSHLSVDGARNEDSPAPQGRTQPRAGAGSVARSDGRA